MTISTKAGLVTAFGAAQTVYMDRGTVTGTANGWNDNITSAVGVGVTAGTLAGTSTTAGVVPTSATTGFPYIRPIGSGKTAYLGSVDFTGSGNAGRIRVCDMLFKAGPYGFADSVTLSSQPSYSARIPSALYAGRTELWFECVTAFTGNPTITVTYTNQDGTTGQSTTYVSTVAPLVNRLIQLPLATGDTGIQKIESVTATVASAGTFNLLVVRPLWNGRVMFAADYGQRYLHGPDKTGLPIVYDTCALFQMFQPDGVSSTGNIACTLKIVEG
jgi:hypothetical protein